MKNKLIAVLLSVVAAFALWLYVITTVSPDSEASFSVYVKVDNENTLKERGMMLNPNHKPVVKLKLSGNRSDLIKLSDDNITVKVDAAKVQEYTPGQKVQLNYTISYPGNVPNNAITVISRNPDYVELDVWEYMEKTVSFEPVFVGEQEPGYMISTAVFGTAQLHISGPKDKIERIVSAKVEIDRTGVKESISKEMEFRFYDEAGQVVDETYIFSEELESRMQVKVDLEVQKTKEIPVVVKLEAGGGATEKNCTVTMSHETILVSGSDESLAQLEALELQPINLSQVLDEETSIECPVQLPAGITNVTGVETITVKVKVNGLATVRLLVRNFIPKNTGNLYGNILKEVLEVTFRGPESQIDRLTADDIIAYVDFTGLTSGTYKDVPVSFAVSGRFSGVGAIGAYTVSAELSTVQKGAESNGLD